MIEGFLIHETEAKKNGFRFILGVDEAGRGPLAGPVVAAAVCLKDTNFTCRIDDSKKMTSCGLFIFNAPWQLDEKLNSILPKILSVIGKEGRVVIE